jgi:hypothetical protein
LTSTLALAIVVELGAIWAEKIIPNIHTVTLQSEASEAVACTDPHAFRENDEFFRDFALPPHQWSGPIWRGLAFKTFHLIRTGS